METGVKGQRTELLIAKREPLLMYSHSSGDSESCLNSSFCSHKDYDQKGNNNSNNQFDEGQIPELPELGWMNGGGGSSSHHNRHELDTSTNEQA